MIWINSIFTGGQPFIHSFIPLACAECDDSLPFSGASSIPLCYVLFPATLLPTTILPSSLTSSCHLFLGQPLNIVVPKFIYNIHLRILFSSILCTCSNQCNLFNLIVSIIVGLHLHKFLYWLISSNFLFHCHILGLKFFYTLSFQKRSVAFYPSLLVSKFLMHMFSVLCIIVFFSLDFSVFDMFLFLKKICSMKYAPPLPLSCKELVLVRSQNWRSLCSIQWAVSWFPWSHHYTYKSRVNKCLFTLFVYVLFL